jgi:hypothetical protein
MRSNEVRRVVSGHEGRVGVSRPDGVGELDNRCYRRGWGQRPAESLT